MTSKFQAGRSTPTPWHQHIDSQSREKFGFNFIKNLTKECQCTENICFINASNCTFMATRSPFLANLKAKRCNFSVVLRVIRKFLPPLDPLQIYCSHGQRRNKTALLCFRGSRPNQSFGLQGRPAAAGHWDRLLQAAPPHKDRIDHASANEGKFPCHPDAE